MGKIDTNHSRAAMHVIDDHICANCLTRPIMSIEFTDDDVLRLHWRLHAVDMRHEKTMVLPRTIRRLRAWAIVTAFCCSGGRRSDGAFCHLTPPSLHTFKRNRASSLRAGGVFPADDATPVLPANPGSPAVLVRRYTGEAHLVARRSRKDLVERGRGLRGLVAQGWATRERAGVIPTYLRLSRHARANSDFLLSVALRFCAFARSPSSQ
jgi:hypothetical protein